jgi:hypothetical protein
MQNNTLFVPREKRKGSFKIKQTQYSHNFQLRNKFQLLISFRFKKYEIDVHVELLMC